MAERVTAHIVVEFGSGDSGLFMSAEVDSREDGLNSGRSDFRPGDSVGILLFKHDSLASVTTEVTAGNLVPLTEGFLEVEDELVTFVDTNEVTLRYPVDGAFTYKWIGVDRGGVQVNNRNVLRKSVDGIGVLKISYVSRYRAYRLNSPVAVSGETEFPIVVLFVGNTE